MDKLVVYHVIYFPLSQIYSPNLWGQHLSGVCVDSFGIRSSDLVQVTPVFIPNGINSFAFWFIFVYFLVLQLIGLENCLSLRRIVKENVATRNPAYACE